MTELDEQVAERLAAVHQRIRAAGGVDVAVLPVTKTHPLDRCWAAYHAGCTAVGENYAQEVVAKFQAQQLPFEVHFIGQLLPLSQNTALFNLLGTTYGGNGASNFALPDLQGRAPMHPGQGPGLSLHDLGETGGSETVTLLESEIPSHNHALRANGLDAADTNVPSPTATFALSSGGTLYQAAPNAQLAPEALAPTGGDQPHNNLMPYLTFYFCIALQGVFPPRT